MSIAWTLKDSVSGYTKPVEDWGLASLMLSRSSQAIDVLSFRHTEADFYGEPLFADEAILTLYRDGVRYFEGIVLPRTKSGGTTGEEDLYRVAGGWWILENWTFQQVWKSYDNGTEQLVDVYKSHVFLGQAPSGQFQNTGAQIAEAVNYIAGEGGAIQFGSAGVAVNCTVDEMRDITCAEVIKKMLRWTPDAVTWFDYATEPPTFHCARRAELGAVSLELESDDEDDADDDLKVVELGSITRREDLVRPSVVIKYEQTISVDGFSTLTTSDDKVPAEATGREQKALNMTISLQGYSVTHTFQDVEVRPINVDELDFWKFHFPYLEDSTLEDMSIESASRTGEFGSELVGGQLAPWMRFPNGNIVLWTRDTATARIKYRDAAGNTITKLVTAKMIGTNAATAKYSTVSSYESGEAVPDGIAQAIFDAVNAPQYDGNVTTVRGDVDGAVVPGKKLNLLRGRAEYETMNAIVWSTVENIDGGRTNIKFGPHRNMTAQDLIELSRVNRNRTLGSNLASRTTATGGVSANVELPSTAPDQSATGEIINHIRHVITHADGMLMDLDSEKLWSFEDVEIETGEHQGMNLKMRKVPYCNDGEDGHVVMLCTEFIPEA